MGITEQSLYHWEQQYKGLGSEPVRELKQPQKENTPLKRVVADRALGTGLLSAPEVLTQNWFLHVTGFQSST